MCAVDGGRTEGGCDFTEWTDYGPCSADCGPGQQARTRSLISISDDADSVTCSGRLSEVKMCNSGPCAGNSSLYDVNNVL